ncbi:MAG TPA: DUF2637 domain-containing protein [Streptosporangiaceae bacterium]|jgi:hypothetical protein
MSIDWRTWRPWLADNTVPLVLAGIAFGGSFGHWVHLARTHGQAGLLGVAVAVCVDLGTYMSARERQRDARIGRARRGWLSWPSLLMIFCIVLTLAGNVASAQHDPWGIVVALIPGAFLLAAISLMERRAAEEGRRRARAEAEASRQAEAERRRRAAEAAETERRAAAERQRQAEAAAAAERQREADRQAEEARQRQADRQAELARRHSQIVTRPSGNVTLRAVPSPAKPTPEGGSATATAVMRAYWDTERAEGRTPTGADLARVADLSSSSSLGRQLRARWLAEADAAGQAELAGARA